MEFLQEFGLGINQWLWLFLCACLIGMAKTGLSGFGNLVVPILAATLGGKASVGILLPILIFADIFAVSYYNRHAQWGHVLKLLPWAIVGIFIGFYFGKKINDEQFKQVIAVLVIVGIVIVIVQDVFKNKLNVPSHWSFAALLGLAGGFATMVGNAAGAIMSLYLLSMRLPKQNFIGTAAWFFFIVNVFKVPLHVFWWKTITLQTFTIDLITLPAIILGVFIGIKTVGILSEKVYRIFIIASTIVAAIFLI